MITFGDVLHETKQKPNTNSRECAVRTENHLNPLKAKGLLTLLCFSSKISLSFHAVKDDE